MLMKAKTVGIPEVCKVPRKLFVFGEIQKGGFIRLPAQRERLYKHRCSHLVMAKKRKGIEDILNKEGGINADPAYVEGGRYLREIGIENQAEIAKILDIAMNPDSLFATFQGSKRSRNGNARRLSVEGDMKPIVEYLEEAGFSREDILQVIRVHPSVLCYKAEDRLKPLISYLSSVGVENPVQVLTKRPSLFGLEVDANLKKIIGYLQNNDYSQEDIIHMLQTSI